MMFRENICIHKRNLWILEKKQYKIIFTFMTLSLYYSYELRLFRIDILRLTQITLLARTGHHTHRHSGKQLHSISRYWLWQLTIPPPGT